MFLKEQIVLAGVIDNMNGWQLSYENLNITCIVSLKRLKLLANSALIDFASKLTRTPHCQYLQLLTNKLFNIYDELNILRLGLRYRD